jgi:hypothetical protein
LHTPGPDAGGDGEPPVGAVGPEPPPPSMAAGPGGPSEFTRVISTQPPPSSPEKRPPAFVPAPKRRRGVSRRGFFIGMTLVVVAALALVLYFAFFTGDRDGGDPEPEGADAVTWVATAEAQRPGAPGAGRAGEV